MRSRRSAARSTYVRIRDYPLASKARWVARRATSGQRALPDFVILGAQKAGTTSIYEYLVEHPDVEGAFGKEVHFFDLHYDRGETWYRASFARRGRGLITGEATPYYLFGPEIPERLHAVAPSARLVVLLRNPVERAFSHWRMEVDRGHEPLSLADAIEAEPGRLRAGFETAAQGRSPDKEFKRKSYVERGRYAAQLERWYQNFDPDQILVLRIEDFGTEPRPSYDRLLRFLDLEAPAAYPTFETYNPGTPAELPPDTRTALAREFEADNARLGELVGINYDLGPY